MGGCSATKAQTSLATTTDWAAALRWKRRCQRRRCSALRFDRTIVGWRPISCASFGARPSIAKRTDPASPTTVGWCRLPPSIKRGAAAPRSVAERTPRPAPRAGKSWPPDGLGAAVRSRRQPRLLERVALPSPVKGSLRRAMRALDRTRHRGCEGSDGPTVSLPLVGRQVEAFTPILLSKHIQRLCVLRHLLHSCFLRHML